MAANTLQFNSENSAFRDFNITQDHVDPKAKDIGDGWVSNVVKLSTNEIRGPFTTTGEAYAAMKLWSKEAEVPTVTEPKE